MSDIYLLYSPNFSEVLQNKVSAKISRSIYI